MKPIELGEFWPCKETRTWELTKTSQSSEVKGVTLTLLALTGL